MELSIVTTMYYSAPYIREFYNRVKATAEKLTNDYEIIFVNDGSPDESLEIVINLHQNDPRVKLIDLSRNFGHHKAIMTGLSYTKGDKIFLIDCDLEEEPEWLENFWSSLARAEDVDVVYGVQKKRKGGYLERVSGDLFYKLFNLISEVKMPTNFLTVRLITARYNQSLLKFREKELVFSIISELAGFNKLPVYVTKGHKNSTSYTFLRRFSILVNAITSSTIRPLWGVFYTGFITTVLSGLYILKLFINKIFFDAALDGWTSLIVSVWFFGGLTIFALGVIGLYISKIFIEIKDRPYTIVKKIYQ